VQTVDRSADSATLPECVDSQPEHVDAPTDSIDASPEYVDALLEYVDASPEYVAASPASMRCSSTSTHCPGMSMHSPGMPISLSTSVVVAARHHRRPCSISSQKRAHMRDTGRARLLKLNATVLKLCDRCSTSRAEDVFA
jgi:hypothetical protein